MKKIVFTLIQPAVVILIMAIWYAAPAAVVSNTWAGTAISIASLIFIQLLEFVNERHTGWRLDLKEFLTDVFYAALYFLVIEKAEDLFAEQPLASMKGALGITTLWAKQLPFVVQVFLVLFVIEFGQYWLHRLMHNSFLWWTHAPHHHVTQLNALKGFVGNPLELFLITLSVIALFDFEPRALFCAGNVLGAVAAFAHANVHFNPPRWYAFIFTTVEPHSRHHSVGFLETRCNYANVLILIDRMFGTFDPGESAVVGQDERKKLTIREQMIFPLRPLIAALRRDSSSAA
jgi:sterol desaturase/sphingolipid hydroxylase (fatty acid hydroxylase superfamily)